MIKLFSVFFCVLFLSGCITKNYYINKESNEVFTSRIKAEKTMRELIALLERRTNADIR